jgi:hypothetical protein
MARPVSSNSKEHSSSNLATQEGQSIQFLDSEFVDSADGWLLPAMRNGRCRLHGGRGQQSEAMTWKQIKAEALRIVDEVAQRRSDLELTEYQNKARYRAGRPAGMDDA